jgi:outer membrane protein assembly factor BamD (BamD/ComL family)
MIVRIALLLILLLPVTACQTIPFTREQALSHKLAEAQKALRSRQLTRATALLSEVTAAPGTPGITDEALIRLALLQLRGGQERDLALALRSLERLAKEYPDSHWTPLADPLADLVSRSQSLARDNRTLRQNIQKIKELELELEQNPTR